MPILSNNFVPTKSHVPKSKSLEILQESDNERSRWWKWIDYRTLKTPSKRPLKLGSIRFVRFKFDLFYSRGKLKLRIFFLTFENPIIKHARMKNQWEVRSILDQFPQILRLSSLGITHNVETWRVYRKILRSVEWYQRWFIRDR